MARVLADEDIYTELVHRLRPLDHDIESAVDLPSRGAPDHHWLIYASETHRTIITHNWRHFLMLHQAWIAWPTHWNVNPVPRHAGILCLPQKDMLSLDQAVLYTDAILSEYRDLSNSYHRLLPTRGWISI